MKTATLVIFLALAALPAAAQTHTVTVTRETCAVLAPHVAAADVEYRQGRDVVSGKPVAPADLPGTPQPKIAEDLTIAITVEIARRFGIPVIPDQYKPEANIGTVTLRDGRAYFNDEPLQDDAAVALAELCRRVRMR
jgi:hypothetical protein